MSDRRRRGVVATAVAIAAGAVVLLWRLRADDATPPPQREPTAVRRLAAWSPTPPATRWSRIAAYAWASPLTLVGLALGALSGSAPTARDGAVLFTGVRGAGGWMLRSRGFAAATLGHVIVALDTPGERLLRHELVHVRQAERWGPLFAPLYLAGLLRYGYRGNPFERAAVAGAGGAPA